MQKIVIGHNIDDVDILAIENFKLKFLIISKIFIPSQYDQKFEFEIFKRKYVNIVDIMTDDDLLQKLEIK